ncbi:hypothetical protein VPNG_04192 [Cytospora leucostoma]|uniref:DNA ligase D 3'-phosphoesterase domain-containing protein n=1 Tax=Cytospora leucostoma TaxID=1230097 RepID=A0A423XDW8_9PEZI|nr:hypothetical protein VPNG_04192 [Cytospora leucostoma]
MGSPTKRKASPELVANPFIKRRNLEWRVSPPSIRDPDRRRRQEADGAGSTYGVPAKRKQSDEEGEGDLASGSDNMKLEGPDAVTSPKSEEIQGKKKKELQGSSGPAKSALIENATVQIEDHLAYFSDLLSARTLAPYPAGHPRLPIPRYRSLYRQSLGSAQGAHFVVTQHDHPVAGPHYDLRLQISGESSCSWAIMYGPPGDPNARGRSGRAGGGVLRNATETRVHCLWNHLVETAGRHTGSLMVWDAGSYEVLPPRRSGYALLDSQEGEEEEGVIGSGGGSGGGGGSAWDGLTQQEKLAKSFASRKIRLRLNGTRLPRGYVVNLRLTREEDAAGRAKAAAAGRPGRGRRRGRQRGGAAGTRKGVETSSSASDDGGDYGSVLDGDVPGEERYEDGSTSTAKGPAQGAISEMEKELRELEDEQVRRTNAYTGAVNSIGSVYQRKWFLSLDREACGFQRTRKDGKVWWERVNGGGGGEEGGDRDEEDVRHRYGWPFYVRGPDHERSVVTGRLGADILRDEGVVGFVRRKGWRPIMS